MVQQWGISHQTSYPGNSQANGAAEAAVKTAKRLLRKCKAGIDDPYLGCFVVRGCAVLRRYINVCNCDMYSVVNVFIDYLKLCVLMVEGMSFVVNVMKGNDFI